MSAKTRNRSANMDGCLATAGCEDEKLQQPGQVGVPAEVENPMHGRACEADQ